jgi:uncharacterized protein (DUF885 family)
MVQDAPVELRRPAAAIAASLLIFVALAPSKVTADTPELAPNLGPASTEAGLEQIFADDAEREQALDPIGSLLRGETVDPWNFSRLFTDALDRDRLASVNESLRALQELDRTSATGETRISLDTFTHAKRQEISGLRPEIRALAGVRPFNHFGGLHIEFPTMLSVSGPLSYQSEADYKRTLALLAVFPTVLENAELRFREGLAKGVVEPKLTVRNMIAQLDDLLATPVEQSPLYSPVTSFPAEMTDAIQDTMRKRFAAAIQEQVNPAYRRLRDFLDREYLPAARDDIGLSAMKGGTALYHWLIERETTLRLEPEKVHQLGLSEVNRIKLEMEGVKRRLGFKGSLAAFFVHVRETPRFHPQTRQELVNGYERIGKEVSNRLPQFFSLTPETPLVIAPYPAFRERYEPGGSYYQGSADAKRPGTFYFNAYDLPSRFLTGMTTLYLHEAVPGHHYQISLAQENGRLPDFQRFGGNSAFVEGWALYAETLGHEMGLYADPMQHWGTLDDEMLRAMRLVVDTGIHAMGWSREQATEYMLDNSGMSRTDAISEVDRYIANPAQALSYKIGAMTIQDLRNKAETALGDRFDIRAFHDQVLGSGALPLPVLTEKIERWLAISK